MWPRDPLSERTQANLRYKRKLTRKLSEQTADKQERYRSNRSESSSSAQVDAMSGVRAEIPLIKIAGSFAGLFVTLRLWQQSSTNELFVFLAAAFFLSSVVGAYSGAFALFRKVPLQHGRELVFPIAQMAMALYFFVQEF